MSVSLESRIFTQRDILKVSKTFSFDISKVIEILDWTNSIYQIVQVERSFDICYYRIKNSDGEVLDRTFYADELNFVSKSKWLNLLYSSLFSCLLTLIRSYFQPRLAPSIQPSFHYVVFKIPHWAARCVLMRYLTLTNDCSKFETDSVGDQVVLKWNNPYDFTNIAYVGISAITFHGFKPNRNHDVLVPVHTNLITRTIMNPRRNILNIRIPRNSHVAESQLNMSKYTCSNNVCLLFR